MRFIYKNARNETREFDLGKNWRERGKYITGYDPVDGHIKHFLKFRVIEYIADSEKMLSDPYPPAPDQLIPYKVPANKKAEHDNRPEILFTGFPSVQKKHLQNKAEQAGLKVVSTVTVNLVYLCGGYNAGPSKLDRARMQGCYILNEAGFFNLITTGELPDFDMLDHVI